MSSARQRLERGVLLAPGLVRRVAAGQAAPGQERWMLAQSREVRRSYVEEVIDAPGDPEVLGQIWMMRQSGYIRESYVMEVLEPEL